MATASFHDCITLLNMSSGEATTKSFCFFSLSLGSSPCGHAGSKKPFVMSREVYLTKDVCTNLLMDV